jgi:GAF domain-containing protein
MAIGPDFARAIAEAARTMSQQQTLEDTLQTIAEVARDSVPGFDHVGISTIDKRGEIRTRAAAGSLVAALDDLQYGLGEGPCVETLRQAAIVVAPRLREDQRWPRYVPGAVKLGLRSQLAVKLYLDGEGTLGGINFYSTISDDISEDAESQADMFATHAAIALGKARERQNLNAALQSRAVIGQALGIIMERFSMPEDRAFAFMVRASSHSNVKLRDIAQAIVDDRNKKR